MSQTGYTPIQLYRSSTASAAPSAGSLADGELAINTTDEKLYFKNSSGVVKLLASTSGGTGTVTSVAATGGTGISVTGSPITSSGTLTITNTAPDQVVSLTGAGTTTVTGTYPNFTITSNDQYAGTVTSVDASGGTTGLTFTGGPITSSGTLTLGGTLAVANGGTGASSLTSGYLVKGNGTSAVSASVVYDNGTNVGIGTSSPSYRLDIPATGAVAANLGGILTGANGTDIVGAIGPLSLQASGANYVGFNTNSSERMRIDSSGNVGIGTSSPDAGLTVEGTYGIMSVKSTTGSKKVVLGGDAFTDAFVGTTTAHNFSAIAGGNIVSTFTTGGNVGIGTTSPSYKLDVATIAVAINQSGYARFGASDAFGMRLGQFSDAGGVPYAGVFGPKDANGYLTFNLGATDQERVRINSSGNVGIGTSSPGGKLEVSNGASECLLRIRGGTAGSSSPQLQFYGNSSDHNWTIVGIHGDAMTFNKGIYGALGSELMRIDSSGNVGIGTSAAYGGRVNVVPASTPTTVAGANQVQIGEATANTGYRLQLGYLNDATAGYVSSVQSYGGGSAAALILNGAGGNVGIGTSSPTSRLTITGGVTEIRDGNYLMLRPSGNGWDMRLQATGTQLDILSGGSLGSPIMSLVNGGNVGIGTSSPGSPLDVLTNSSALGIAIRGRSSDNVGALALRSNDGATIYGQVQGRSTDFRLEAGSSNVLTAYTNASERMRIDSSGNVGIGTSSPAGRLDISGNFVSNIVAVAASAIDCTTGNFFTKTATGALTWTITNPPSSRVYSFLLELTNGGTGTQTWFSGIKWPGGVAPTLTTSGVDVLGFYTDDNGTTWRGVQLMKDSK